MTIRSIPTAVPAVATGTAVKKGSSEKEFKPAVVGFRQFHCYTPTSEPPQRQTVITPHQR